MRVAILTVPGDYHSHAVAWGLKERGVAADLVFFTDVPQKASLSLRPADDGRIELGANGGTLDLAAYDRFWLRRPNSMVPPETLAAGDVALVQTDWRDLLLSILEIIGLTGAFCINPADAYHRGHLKALHLDIARRCGLKIPRTLISNARDQILDFIVENRRRGRDTIVKGFRNSSWVDDSGRRSIFSTVRIEAQDLAGSDVGAAPNIFQEYLDKKIEVRVAVMGRSLFAASLDSQKYDSSKLDFRNIDDWSKLGCRPIEVPPAIAACIFRFQQLNNFNFGSMDFIVDHEDNWFFLETNTVGNFLWVESYTPQIPLLDAMVGFIMSGRADFVYEPGLDDALALARFEDSSVDNVAIRQHIATEVRTHVRRPRHAVQE